MLTKLPHFSQEESRAPSRAAHRRRQCLKIDKSFVDGVGRHGKECELAQSIIELDQTLNLEIVAEGVERAAQLGWLKARRCDLAQGFLFAHALDADTLANTGTELIASLVSPLAYDSSPAALLTVQEPAQENPASRPPREASLPCLACSTQAGPRAADHAALARCRN